MSELSAEQVIELLGLVPHPEEGGFFSETHRTAETVHKDHLPDRYDGPRHHSTAIYYLLTPTTYSHLHKLESDEVFHFYHGNACEMLQLYPNGTYKTVILGQDLAAGQQVQVVVPRGVWQGMRLVPGGSYGLMGCTVAPGFEFADYSHASRTQLLEQFPQAQELITLLTTEHS